MKKIDSENSASLEDRQDTRRAVVLQSQLEQVIFLHIIIIMRQTTLWKYGFVNKNRVGAFDDFDIPFLLSNCVVNWHKSWADKF